mmetsp:Transcript_15361/g.15176  ORF Transcript_15361/g.15176 Transcript_15361/m.15176 type:complete len:96 (+) Transcript_15361:59-346(+)
MWIFDTTAIAAERRSANRQTTESGTTTSSSSAEGQTLHGAVGIIRNALDELRFATGETHDNDGTSELLEQVGRQLVGDAAMLSSYPAHIKIQAGA